VQTSDPSHLLQTCCVVSHVCDEVRVSRREASWAPHAERGWVRADRQLCGSTRATWCRTKYRQQEI
jgi:hypothetical protein